MDWSPKVLGITASEHLQKQVRGIVLKIGKDDFTKRHLADTSCFNFIAAQNLTVVLKELGAKSTQDVYENYSPIMLAVPRIGAISLAVLGAAFELKNLGGSNPLENWVRLHRDPKNSRKELLTFSSVKAHARDMEAERRTKAAERSAQQRKRQQKLKQRANVMLTNAAGV